MLVADVMTRDVRVAAPNQTIGDAARAMAELDAGALPVGEDGRLVGMITDRDLTIRAVAVGKGPDTPVRDVMTSDVRYCFDDEDVAEVLRAMGEQQVRRMPVVNRDKRLVGILSLGTAAVHGAAEQRTGAALSDVSSPGGRHSQTG